MAAATIAVVLTVAAISTRAPAAIEERALSLYNIHNEERLEIIFKARLFFPSISVTIA